MSDSGKHSDYLKKNFKLRGVSDTYFTLLDGLLKALTNSALLTEVNQQAQPTYDVTCIRKIRAQAPLSSPKNACVGDYIGRRHLAARASAPPHSPPANLTRR